MKVSLRWLKRYVDLEDLSTKEIAATLTGLGLEVEDYQNIAGIHEKVIVGKIEKTQPHPNADSLQLCKVNVGSDEQLLDIVCGAPNAREGIYVAVATVGATLPGDFKIKASKIRGEKSAGMLCSQSELEIGNDSDGIMELSQEFSLGSQLADELSMKDTVFEIGLTPNRADCLGHIGIARDLAAKLQKPLRLPDVKDTLSSSKLSSTSTADKLEIKVASPELSARFAALYMKDVSVVDSPTWLQSQLLSAGMRPINLVVDVTNFVMLEYGQPIHAYDLRDIQGATIEVRNAVAKEKIITLDAQERILDHSDIVIADASKAIGIAGVMGGENSEVKTDTSEIIIEVAHFNQTLVRKTAKRLAIHSEASHRFERGVDETKAIEVAERVASLLIDCSRELKLEREPKLASTALDYHPTPRSLAKVALRTERLRAVTGIRVLTQQQAIDYLEGLGFQFLDKTDERAVFTVPSWRLDCQREIDLIEEVVRVHGYEQIPYKLPIMEIGGIKENPFIEFIEQCKTSAAMLGLTETISFPFIEQKQLNDLKISEDHVWNALVRLTNPLVEDQCFLRPTLLPSLMVATLGNRRHGRAGTKLFEVARAFYDPGQVPLKKAYPELTSLVSEAGKHVSRPELANLPAHERNLLGGLLDQPLYEKDWQSDVEFAGFFAGKKLIESFLGSFGLSPASYSLTEKEQFPFLHPGASALIAIDNKPIGFLGEIHPEVALAYDLSGQESPVVFELYLDEVFQAMERQRNFDTSIQKYPSVKRDLALVFSSNVTHAEVEKCMGTFNRRKNLRSFNLFDVYQGDKLPESKKSMAFSLEFQSEKKSLTDKEVEKEVSALIAWFGEQMGAELR